MTNPTEFMNIVQKYISESGYSVSKVSQLAGIPRKTLVNWLEGRVKKPQKWVDLIKLATILRLTETETTQLLQAAKHPSLFDLMAKNPQAPLLSPWQLSATKHNNLSPFQAMADIPFFVGREEEVAQIRTILLNPSHSICVIEGLGGCGKTALATRMAYLLKEEFPDGILWAQPSQSNPLAILAAFANAYGQNVRQYTDLQSRSQFVRGLLAHKKALLIFDDVQKTQDLQELLPPTGSCSTLITTRRRDLAVTLGVRHLTLPTFNTEKQESLQLFTKILGNSYVQKHKTLLKETAHLLGHLPLAISIVASRVALEPEWVKPSFLERLHLQEEQLNHLTDGERSVQYSFLMSYESLPPPQQCLFAMLGLFAHDGFTIEAVAHIASISLSQAQDDLLYLYRLSLIQVGRYGRYQLHPLLREYARDHLQEESVWSKMVDYFIEYAQAYRHDLQFLTQEADNVKEVLAISLTQKMDERFVSATIAFYHFWYVKGLYDEVKTYLQQALHIAQTLNYPAQTATLQHYLGQIHGKQGRYAEAEICFAKSLESLRGLADEVRRLTAVLISASSLAGRQGKFQQAKVYLQEGLTLAQRTEEESQISGLLSNLGAVHFCLGEYEQAQEMFLEGLDIARSAKKYEREIILLINLGEVLNKQGQLTQAKSFYQDALSISREMDYRLHLDDILSPLGDLAFNQNEYEQAESFYRQALEVARQMKKHEKTSILLANLGQIAQVHNQLQEAETYFTQALEQARQIERPRHLATILYKWGHFCLDTGQYNQAEQAFQESLTVAQQHKLPELQEKSLSSLSQI